MTILVIAEHDNLHLKSSTLSTITAASLCAQRGVAGTPLADIHVLVAGQNVGSVVQSVAGLDGVTTVLVAEAPYFEHGLAENIATQIVAVVTQAQNQDQAHCYTHILAPATAYGKNILPRVAATLGVAQISDIIKVHTPDTFDRPIYAGNAIATVQSQDPIKVMTVRATAFDATNPANPPRQADVKTETPVADGGLSTFVSRELATSSRPELTAAKIVVSGGRGLGSAENFALLEQLADKLGAAMGASRAAVDAGYVPNDWQVGQTGKIVAPQLYIAVGISGAIQHLAGMKDAKTIVAINKDADAPIFDVADYGLVGDLFQIVPQLIAALDA